MDTQEHKFITPSQREQQLVDAFRRSNIRFVEVLASNDWDINNRQVGYALQDSDAIGDSLTNLYKSNRHNHPLQNR